MQLVALLTAERIEHLHLNRLGRLERALQHPLAARRESHDDPAAVTWVATADDHPLLPEAVQDANQVRGMDPERAAQGQLRLRSLLPQLMQDGEVLGREPQMLEGVAQTRPGDLREPRYEKPAGELSSPG